MENLSQPKSIYAIQNKTTKRMYIGCTIDLQSRVKTHFTELEKGIKQSKGKDTQWQTDFNLYGRDDFDIFVVEENIPYDICLERENYYIGLYETFIPEKGYNLTSLPKEPLVFIYGMPELQTNGGCK